MVLDGCLLEKEKKKLFLDSISFHDISLMSGGERGKKGREILLLFLFGKKTPFP